MSTMCHDVVKCVDMSASSDGDVILAGVMCGHESVITCHEVVECVNMTV